MTLLVVPVFGSSIEELEQGVESAIRQGADAIELRIDLMENVGRDDLRRLREAARPTVPIILTIRSTDEGGTWDGPDADRVSRIIELAPWVDYIDVELSLWRRSANVRQKIGLALRRTEQTGQASGVESNEPHRPRKLLLSKHDVTSRPRSLHGDLVEMVGNKNCDVVKLAWRARTVRDNFEAFELMRESPKPAIIICMGEDGLASRILARKFGGFATFVSIDSKRETAAGQISILEMRQRYRWDAIDQATRVFGLIGDPVKHSLGTIVHNAGFAAIQSNCVYLPFRVDPSFESFKAFMMEVLSRPWLDLGGFSVTSPHKENALRFVQEAGGMVDPAAAGIGAVNTLVLAPNGKLQAFNSDSLAAIKAICDLCACDVRDMAGREASILGAGGVARAVASSLVDAGARVTIFNRDFERARALADRFGGRAATWEDRLKNRSWLLVNCTSVGLLPDDASPMPEEALPQYEAVFDTVYNLPQTKLVADASRRGIPAATGFEMFIAQAADQFARWTGQEAPLTVIRAAAKAALGA